MISVPRDELMRRAEAVLAAVAGRGAGLRRALRAEVVAGESLVGGGTFPDARIPSAMISLGAGEEAERWLARLRAHTPPVIARRRKGRIALDLRTVAPEEDGVVAAALAALGEAIRAGAG